MKVLKIIFASIFFILLAILIFSKKSNLSEDTSAKQIVEDFVFKTDAELTKKYGNPTTETYLKSNTWKLPNDVNVIVFYTDKSLQKRDILRFKNLNIDTQIFYNDLGWELPHLKPDYNAGQCEATGLQGIEKATYYDAQKTLNIVLDNPQISTFGKKDL